MKPTHRSIAATAALLLASMTGVAAQERSASPMPPMMQGGGMERGGMMPMMGMGMMRMADHVEGRIAFLKTELKITDAQLPQWNTFADALRSNARRMVEMRGTVMQGGMMGQVTALNAPDRLDHMDKMMTAMLETVRSTKAALGPLYAVLSDEQKKVADALLRGPMGMMGSM
jgi:hypothetical protein